MEDDIIGELRGAFDRRAWNEVAAIFESTVDAQQRNIGYEWLRAAMANHIRSPDSGTRLLSGLLGSLNGERDAPTIDLRNNTGSDIRCVALGNDGIMRERVLTTLEDGSQENRWIEIEFRCLVMGARAVIPTRWLVAKRIRSSSGDGIYLEGEGENESLWQLLYGGQWPDRWILSKWGHKRIDD